MVVTFLLELASCLYVIWRYRLSAAGSLIAGILLLLAIFQVSEFQVCRGSGGLVSTWSRLGFVGITMLPPISLHLVHVITGRWRRLVYLAYATMLPWLLLFGLPRAFNGYMCLGNYVIFQLRPAYNYPYLVYYYLWLGVGVMLCFHTYKHLTRRYLRALRWQGLGYLTFILPTLLANTILPRTLYAIPSIMCGFAVLYAIILTARVAPLLLKQYGR